MSKNPIEIFKNEEQFQKCCREWQHKLFLDNWFIRFIAVGELIAFEDGKLADGVCEYNFDNKEALIKIYNGIDTDEHNICKHCAEQVIIHELLHLKQEYISEKDTFETKDKNFHEYIVHQSTDVMAKSLLMVKYNLDYDYFYKE